MILVTVLGILESKRNSGDEGMNYLQQSVEGKVQENGIPFSMKLDTVPENKGIKAMKAASFIGIENGISEMTLDEINAEIAEARK